MATYLYKWLKQKYLLIKNLQGFSLWHGLLSAVLYVLLIGGEMPILYAQQNKADSLEKLLLTTPLDTQRVNILNQLSFAIYSINPDKSKTYADTSLLLAQKHKFQKGIAQSYVNLGQYHRQKGDFSQALTYLVQGLEIFETIKFTEGIGNTYITIGLINGQQSNFSQAHEYHLKALALYEKQKNIEKIAVCLANIGTTYTLQNEYNLALEYHFKALPMSQLAKDEWREMLCYHNIGTVYSKKNSHDTALIYFNKAIALAKTINIPIGRILIAMGDTYLSQKKYDLAIITLTNSIQSFEKISNKYHLTEANNLVGKAYLSTNQRDSALFFYQKALHLATNIGAKAFRSVAYQGISQYYQQKKQIDSAFFYQSKYIDLRDSIYNEEIYKKATFAKSAYDLNQKQYEIDILQEQHQNEVIIRNLIIVVSILLLLSLAYIFYNSQKIKKVNLLLHQQHLEIQAKTEDIILKSEEIMMQNEELQQQQKEIMTQRELIQTQNENLSMQNIKVSQSILAAHMIQKAILPPQSKIDNLFPENFIYYKPKDVVGGDFYWFEKKEAITIVAAIDCTGHGVPGAFMTLIVNGLMERLVRFTAITTPANLLTDIHIALNNLLQENEEQGGNGMDIAIIFLTDLDKHTKQVMYAGAKNDIFIYQEDTTNLQIIKSNRNSVGGNLNPHQVLFTNHVVNLPANSIVYMGSDGLADQNNLQRMRFSKKRLIQTITNVMHKPLPLQKQEITTELEKFMGKQAQRDDILLLGLRM
jgi:serine phosphatase RsbU (regulator of sigma subunit)